VREGFTLRCWAVLRLAVLRCFVLDVHNLLAYMACARP
jgi:hypothetical protein